MRSIFAAALGLLVAFSAFADVTGNVTPPGSNGQIIGTTLTMTNSAAFANQKKWSCDALGTDGPDNYSMTCYTLNDDGSNPNGSPFTGQLGCNYWLEVDRGDVNYADPTVTPTAIQYIVIGNPCSDPPVAIEGELQIQGTDPIVKYFKDNGATPVYAEGIVDYSNPTAWSLYDMLVGDNVMSVTSGSPLVLGTAAHGALMRGPLVIPVATPGSSGAACAQGQFEADASYVYICTATNTWKRAALSTF